MKFKIDENIPVDCADLFLRKGYEAETVYQEELHGCSDKTYTFLVWFFSRLAGKRAHRPPDFLVAGVVILAPLLAATVPYIFTSRTSFLPSPLDLHSAIFDVVAGTVYGVLYWKKGLESAVVAHVTAVLTFISLN